MLVYVDIDTQDDFVNEDGALPVPGAKDIRPNLKALTNNAVSEEILILATADCHYGHEPELKINGGLFPNHCMMGTPGASNIPETCIEDGLVVPTDCRYDGSRKKGKLTFQKQCPDVFDQKSGGNKEFAKFLERTGNITAVVYGVATDYCVKAAVLGLLKAKGVKEVYLVTDAIASVDMEPGDGQKALDEMMAAGAIDCNTSQVLAMTS